MSLSLQPKWQLLAVSGSQNLIIPMVLTSALPPEAAIELVGLRGAASDPKKSFSRRNSFGQSATNSLCVDGLALLESVQLQP